MPKKPKKLTQDEFVELLAATVHRERLRTDAKIAAIASAMQEALEGLRVITKGLAEEAEARTAKLEGTATPDSLDRSLAAARAVARTPPKPNGEEPCPPS